MKRISTQKDVQDLSITVYNNGFGVIKERRAIDIKKDVTHVHYVDVAEKIETDSLMVKGLHILEMNYDYDLVSKEKLLEKYLDRQVWVINKEDGTKKGYRLLSVMNGMVLEDTETKEIVINPQGELLLPGLPDELIVKPALIWKVLPSESKSVAVSYMTKGLAWTANYVINLEHSHLKLSGWVEIRNSSGGAYENAQVKLIAGEVNRVEDIRRYSSGDIILYDEAASPSFEEKSFADYHMYTVQNRTSLKQNQSKQIQFIELDQIPYQKYYAADRWSEKVLCYIEIKNNKESGMGIPLPEGVMKVYQEDRQDHHLEFIGEDSIDHTPKDEKIALCLGEAFDIRCSGVNISSHRSGRYLYERYQYTIRNHKDEAVLVKIPHHISGEWEMVEHSDPYEKERNDTIVFWINAEANANKTVAITYRINKGITVEVKNEDEI